MQQFPDRQSHRLRWFDIRSSQTYFVTICTHDRMHFFGRIRHETMYLNEIGKLSRSVWTSLPERFPGVQLGGFVFMPNHFHGLFIIHQQTNITNMPQRFRTQKQAMMEERYPQLEKPYQQPTSAEIVRTFKAASTRHIRVSGRHDFAWQEKYWGELILDDNRFNVVSNYIRDNPRRWEKDKLYKPEA